MRTDSAAPCALQLEPADLWVAACEVCGLPEQLTRWRLVLDDVRPRTWHICDRCARTVQGLADLVGPGPCMLLP